MSKHNYKRGFTRVYLLSGVAWVLAVFAFSVYDRPKPDSSMADQSRLVNFEPLAETPPVRVLESRPLPETAGQYQTVTVLGGEVQFPVTMSRADTEKAIRNFLAVRAANLKINKPVIWPSPDQWTQYLVTDWENVSPDYDALAKKYGGVDAPTKPADEWEKYAEHPSISHGAQKTGDIFDQLGREQKDAQAKRNQDEHDKQSRELRRYWLTRGGVAFIPPALVYLVFFVVLRWVWRGFAWPAGE